MRGYLKRLLTTGAAYQFGDIVAKGIALVTIPLYTRHISPAGYGAANSLLTAVILASIFLRVGVGEAFIRFYFDDDDLSRRARIARTATATVAWTTTAASLLALIFSGALSRLILGYQDALLIDCAIVGLWAFTNLEMAYAQLRVDERARAYVFASGANVGLTVIFTITLVVVAGQGARGLLLGNFGASALVVLGLWWVLRRRFSLRVHWPDLRAMMRFGLPTVPADASVYALQVADRFYLFRGYSHAAAGDYSVALQFATVVFVVVRGFQYAWPPLAYSIESDAEASKLYSLVTTYFVLATGVVVAAVALLGRWIVRLLAAREYFGAHAALPWLALAWTLYGLYQVMIVITGRARVTSRNLPGAAAGLVVNVALLLVLVPSGGLGLGIAGAGIALCGAYVAMLIVMHLLTRRLFVVGFEWRRLAQLTAIFTAVAVSGELLLPTSGFAGLALRILWLALIPVLLALTRFFGEDERSQARALVADGRRRVAAFRAGHGEVEEYAEDPLKDI
ncbi:MAG TPA: lipopolysaccharide biosynthesis protein [Solirubrobacteraceae bacterium]|jgi:O-antigen/teichoic acid export membrane protein|nr:lipopolysaccharide biosynthesis protein [Solirubrobacteraceae bacterium]